MKALVFRYSFPRFAFATVLGKINPPAYLGPGGPLSLETIPEPIPLADDWVIVRTGLCGICGSDIKQVFLLISRKVISERILKHLWCLLLQRQDVILSSLIQIMLCNDEQF